MSAHYRQRAGRGVHTKLSQLDKLLHQLCLGSPNPRLTFPTYINFSPFSLGFISGAFNENKQREMPLLFLHQDEDGNNQTVLFAAQQRAMYQL